VDANSEELDLSNKDVKIEGAIISNELLDEFDPIKIKLVWKTGKPPGPNDVRNCDNWREGHVMHRIQPDWVPDKRWIAEANAAACAYLDDPWIQRLIYKEFPKPDKRCFPTPCAVCRCCWR